MIDELKNNLVGKTILSVEQGYGEACICQLSLIDKDKNKQYLQIHANDLGSWIKHINKIDDGSIVCDSLGDMFSEFNEYLFCRVNTQDFSHKVGITVVVNTSVMFKWFDTGQIFRCQLKHDWEKEITIRDNFFDLAREAILCGSFYKEIFDDELPVPIDYK